MEFDIEDFRLEIILGIVGVLTLIGFFMPWAEAGGITFRGYEFLEGDIVFVASWVMIVATMISYDAFSSRTLDNMRPYLDSGLGAIGGALGLIGSMAFIVSPPDISTVSTSWGVQLVLVACAVGIGISFAIFITGGEPSSEPRKKKRSGGL